MKMSKGSVILQEYIWRSCDIVRALLPYLEAGE